jgi:hypothetical protein
MRKAAPARNTAHPEKRSLLVFELKAACFRARRFAVDVRSGVSRWPLAGVSSGGALVAEVSTPLRSGAAETDSGEARLIEGKVHNLQVALARLDGAVVPAGGTFSFWRQLGRASRRAGYVEGRELREGCIIPSLGGGICQLSNALYAAALDAGCEIVERHAHSQIVPGSAAARGRDATVFWNYVDLRFRPQFELTIRCALDDDRLVVRFLSARSTVAASEGPSIVRDAGEDTAGRPSCMSCRQVTCSRHRKIHGANPVVRSAFLLDAYWPEHDVFIASRSTSSDVVCVPLDGRRVNLSQYAWALERFGVVRQARIETFVRAMRSRRLAAHGAERQRAMLRDAERLARRFARLLPKDAAHAVVMQNLLPYLWRDGSLTGRTFDVLMTSLPMHTIHDVLDEAARLHPSSTTLADFRAPREIVEGEREALEHARLVVTPHHDVARRFGARALLLPWSIPVVPQVRTPASNDVLFAGATLGRSGAYEMREAARRSGVAVVLVGDRDPECRDFWSGVEVKRVADFGEGLKVARVVALPAFVEHRPRGLLHALSAGASVIASDACGLAPANNLTIVATGDADAFTAAIERFRGSPDREHATRATAHRNRLDVSCRLAHEPHAKQR